MDQFPRAETKKNTKNQPRTKHQNNTSTKKKRHLSNKICPNDKRSSQTVVPSPAPLENLLLEVGTPKRDWNLSLRSRAIGLSKIVFRSCLRNTLAIRGTLRSTPASWLKVGASTADFEFICFQIRFFFGHSVRLTIQSFLQTSRCDCGVYAYGVSQKTERNHRTKDRCITRG